ncbi:ATPase [Halieaceae bacterium IMCC14734]|uniref:ATPase n=1 Tax=Candidatus Litorirhabdus singularis TaxID=2518993 RepID=A0ABT3TC21_9GAMM|nr:peptidoglycan DD-metalloendopeptidase family protein [Candidatus Litorirhabdus singularis]MCX2979836.1 ATPase [Candidatus Litorirhabdus singularis]
MPTPSRLCSLAGAALLALALLNPPALADEESDAREKLGQLEQAIEQLNVQLQQDLRTRGSLQDALQVSERSIARLQSDIQRTRSELKQTTNRLAALQLQRGDLEIARGEQEQLIRRELKTAYQMGRQGQLKILLNQEQPDTLARNMAYYEYFYRARKEHIASYLETIERINQLEPEIASTAERLAATQKMLDQQRGDLLLGQRQREQDLASLNAGIQSKDAQLQKLNADRSQLEQLLEVIEAAVADLDTPASYQGFAELKGQLIWPITGKPQNRFGSSRSGSLRWQGLMIPAPEGSPVSAIHYGRVVFADWFRGSGLLLIIDHGDGYMSLYAHNQTLLRDVGEWVAPGAEIATVGNSGGRQQAALYFEIRQQGKPTNPGPWLRDG